MKFTRREFIKAGVAASAFPSIWMRASRASAQLCEATSMNSGVNLIIVQLQGGNDGINTVVPMSGPNRDDPTWGYDVVRPVSPNDSSGIGIAASDLANTQIGDDPGVANAHLGLHPHMTRFKSLYDSGNLAVLLGLYYDKQDDPLSHDYSERVWYRADPEQVGPGDGWMGRTLDESLCLGAPAGSVPAVVIDNQVTPLFYGNTDVFAFNRPSDLVFPTISNLSNALKTTYKNTFKNIYSNAQTGANFLKDLGTAGFSAVTKLDAYNTASAHSTDAKNLNDLIIGRGGPDAGVAAAQGLGGFGVYGPDNFGLARQLRTVFSLMRTTYQGAPLGCRIFRVTMGGFDSHSTQGVYFPNKPIIDKIHPVDPHNYFVGEFHGQLLHQVDAGIAAFWQDCIESGLSSNTVIMTFSEFGRRIAQNKNKDQNGNPVPGTDHGTAGPHFVIGPKAGEASGPAAIVGGTYGVYPDLLNPHSNGSLQGSPQSTPVDFRLMYGEIMEKWLQVDLATTQGILGNTLSAGTFQYGTGPNTPGHRLGFLA